MRISGLFSVSILLLSSGAQAADQKAGFHILEPSEIARHQQALAQLQGDEREQYRNRVYENLVQRARSQGYEMAAVPPWQQQARVEATFRPEPASEQGDSAVPLTNPMTGPSPRNTPPAQPENLPPEPDMKTLIARQERVIEEAVQQQLNDLQEAAQPASGETPADAATSAANHYREKMRKRFDEFMARREARQRQDAGVSGAPEQHAATTPPALAPSDPARAPAGVQAQPYQPYPVPPIPWGMPPVPMYPQPLPPQPLYPQPAQPQPGAPGMPPFGYPPAQTPGWY